MAMNSSINDKNINEEEESGWTKYLDDFSCNNDSFISSSSMVSDAAWNGSSDTIKKLNLNKLNRRRKYTYEYNDSLEDTASSPVHSPKVIITFFFGFFIYNSSFWFDFSITNTMCIGVCEKIINLLILEKKK